MKQVPIYSIVNQDTVAHPSYELGAICEDTLVTPIR